MPSRSLPRVLEREPPPKSPILPLRALRRSTRRASGATLSTRRRTWSSMATLQSTTAPRRPTANPSPNPNRNPNPSPSPKPNPNQGDLQLLRRGRQGGGGAGVPPVCTRLAPGADLGPRFPCAEGWAPAVAACGAIAKGAGGRALAAGRWPWGPQHLPLCKVRLSHLICGKATQRHTVPRA